MRNVVVSTALLLTVAAGPESVRIWIGRETVIETHLKTARVTDLEEIGTGVTRPRRGHLTPADPAASIVWKVLPPGRRGGYWESYKSEVAAYELDKLLALQMVPPAVERQVNGETGAAVLWIDGIKSVKQAGGKVPTGDVWGRAIRRMQLFDNFIGNHDRNAGNILLGEPGELVLIDHSRAFVDDRKLPFSFERVDATLWERVSALTADDLRRHLEPWIDDKAIEAMLERRQRISSTVQKLTEKKGRAAVIIP